jgi:acyl carrier protein
VAYRCEQHLRKPNDKKGLAHMDRAEIEVKLSDLLVDELGIERDNITMDAKFEEDLEVDSLGVVELLMALEDNFSVKIPDEEAEQITTVGEAIDLVQKKLDEA